MCDLNDEVIDSCPLIDKNFSTHQSHHSPTLPCVLEIDPLPKESDLLSLQDVLSRLDITSNSEMESLSSFPYAVFFPTHAELLRLQEENQHIFSDPSHSKKIAWLKSQIGKVNFYALWKATEQSSSPPSLSLLFSKLIHLSLLFSFSSKALPWQWIFPSIEEDLSRPGWPLPSSELVPDRAQAIEKFLLSFRYQTPMSPLSSPTSKRLLLMVHPRLLSNIFPRSLSPYFYKEGRIVTDRSRSALLPIRVNGMIGMLHGYVLPSNNEEDENWLYLSASEGILEGEHAVGLVTTQGILKGQKGGDEWHEKTRRFEAETDSAWEVSLNGCGLIAPLTQPTRYGQEKLRAAVKKILRESKGFWRGDEAEEEECEEENEREGEEREEQQERQEEVKDQWVVEVSRKERRVRELRRREEERRKQEEKERKGRVLREKRETLGKGTELTRELGYAEKGSELQVFFDLHQRLLHLGIEALKNTLCENGMEVLHCPFKDDNCEFCVLLKTFSEWRPPTQEDESSGPLPFAFSSLFPSSCPSPVPSPPSPLPFSPLISSEFHFRRREACKMTPLNFGETVCHDVFPMITRGKEGYVSLLWDEKTSWISAMPLVSPTEVAVHLRQFLQEEGPISHLRTGSDPEFFTPAYISLLHLLCPPPTLSPSTLLSPSTSFSSPALLSSPTPPLPSVPLSSVVRSTLAPYSLYSNSDTPKRIAYLLNLIHRVSIFHQVPQNTWALYLPAVCTVHNLLATNGASPFLMRYGKAPSLHSLPFDVLLWKGIYGSTKSGLFIQHLKGDEIQVLTKDRWGSELEIITKDQLLSWGRRIGDQWNWDKEIGRASRQGRVEVKKEKVFIKKRSETHWWI